MKTVVPSILADPSESETRPELFPSKLWIKLQSESENVWLNE
jgi:hypothetical protein